MVYEHAGMIDTIEADFDNTTGNIEFRATFPMNRLVALAMVTTVVSMTVQLVEGSSTTSLVLVALTCATSAIGLAIMRTVRSAVRLGRRADDDHTASLLARTILRDHVTSFVLMAVALVAINMA